MGAPGGKILTLKIDNQKILLDLNNIQHIINNIDFSIDLINIYGIIIAVSGIKAKIIE
jgi:hypothetical protein